MNRRLAREFLACASAHRGFEQLLCGFFSDVFGEFLRTYGLARKPDVLAMQAVCPEALVLGVVLDAGYLLRQIIAVFLLISRCPGHLVIAALCGPTEHPAECYFMPGVREGGRRDGVGHTRALRLVC